MNKDKNKSKRSTVKRMTPEMNRAMDLFRYMESSDRSGIRAKKRDKKTKELVNASSGYGYYQVLTGTLNEINKSVVADGYEPLTLNTREENHEAMRRLLIQYDEYLRNNMGIKNPTVEDYYGVHFNGKARYKNLKRASPNDRVGQYVSSNAVEANPEMYGGTIADLNKKIGEKISDAAKQLKKESPERRASVAKEKAGFDLGLATPLDVRPGTYKNDGEAAWDENASYPNGRKIGDQLFDYTLDKTLKGDKVIKANSKDEVLIQGNREASSNSYFGNAYDPNSPFRLKDGVTTVPEASNYSILGTQGYSGNQGFGAELNPMQDVQSRKPKSINYERASRKDIANIGTALYNNPDNPGSAIGNQPHQMVNIDGRMVAMDAQPRSVNPAITQAQDLLAANPTIARNNAQQQFQLGGDMNQVNNQSNDTLISFDEGGSHETNPLGGIPQNMNPDGTQNTVEQGETKHKDYVFSDTLTVLPAEAEELMLPEEIEGMTYADASKFLNKTLEENENDPIVKRTVERQLENLKAGNERARLKIEEQQLAEQEYEAELQADKIASQQAENQGNVSGEAIQNNNVGGMDGSTGNFSPTGEASQSIPQQYELDPNMGQNIDPNEQLLTNDSLDPNAFAFGGNLSGNRNREPVGFFESQYINERPLLSNRERRDIIKGEHDILNRNTLLDELNRQYNFKLGGKMLVYGGLDDGLNDWNRPYLTGEGEVVEQQPTEVQQGLIDAGHPTADQVGGTVAPVLSATGNSTAGAIGGMVSGGLAAKDAFTLKDQVNTGQKIDKGAVALKGAAAGATIGGSVGSVVPVVGTAIGAAAGAVIGGVSGLVVGNQAQKKAEKKRDQLDALKYGHLTSDFRTASGTLEGETKEFLLGGDLENPYDRMIDPANYYNQEYRNRVAPYFELDDNILNQLNPNPAIVNTGNYSTQAVASPVRGSDVSSTNSKGTTSVSTNDSGTDDTGDGENKPFTLPGGNLLRYAGLYGAYDQMRRWQDKPNWEDSYMASGLRYEPQFADEDLMMNQIRTAGRTTDRVIQDNANGSASTARANLVASSGNTAQALSDAYLKTLEFNNAQRQFALQNDNQILANRDAIMNRQAENNMANRQAEYRLEQSARNNWYDSLAKYGREREDQNITQNMTNYDIYGNRVGNSKSDQLANRIVNYFKSKRNKRNNNINN